MAEKINKPLATTHLSTTQGGEQAKKKESNKNELGDLLANTLREIADTHSGAITNEKFQKTLQKIDQNNVIDVIEAYDKNSSNESIIEMIHVLDAIRLTMIKASIPQMKEEDFQSLENILHEQKECDDPFEFERLNYQFHKILIFLSSNGFAEDLSSMIDANIGRYTDILKEFTKYSQFLVISHNKRTMSAAQTIYGVTMQERGVTRLISMRFNRQNGEAEAEEEVSQTF